MKTAVVSHEAAKIETPEEDRLECRLSLHDRVVAERGIVAGLSTALRDTRVRVFRLENELRQLEAQQRALWMAAGLGFALLAENGEIESASARLRRMLGLGPETPSRNITDYTPDLRREDFATLLSAVKEQAGHQHMMEMVVELPGRGERNMNVSVQWIPEIARWLLTLEDVTSDNLLQLRANEEEKRSMLESLVGGVAHELNNKLTPIIGFASLLDGGMEREQAEGYGRLIGQSAVEASRIIEQLLHLSRPVRPQRELCTVQGIVNDALTLLKFRMRDSGVELQTGMPAEPLELHADPGQLKQVMMNLCLNAIDAMEAVTRRQLAITAFVDGECVIIKVRDSGAGIPSENMSRIFQPFFTTKGPQAGTGLGLSICAGVVAQHGGGIDVRSTPGLGTEFSVRIPRITGAGVQRPGDGGLLKTVRQRIPGTVLVADDEEVIVRLVGEILHANFDCKIAIAADGEAALRRCEEGDVSLVISDLRMPVMTGAEFHKRLRETNPALAGRFVFMTGNDTEAEFRRLIEESGLRLLPKPFTPAQLLGHLAGCLEAL